MGGINKPIPLNTPMRSLLFHDLNFKFGSLLSMTKTENDLLSEKITKKCKMIIKIKKN